MREINPDIRVLLSSGYSINGQASEILERGCDSFIHKPFDMRQLRGPEYQEEVKQKIYLFLRQNSPYPAKASF